MALTFFAPRAHRVALASIGIGVAAALTISGCTDGGTDGSSGDMGDHVPYGSSPEVYQEALADMEPVTLIMQSSSASAELPTNKPVLEFVDFIDEYSGGKITVDVTYANGIVSNILEWDDGLVDGRLDIGAFYPQYDAAEYPVTNAFTDIAILRDPEYITGFYSVEAWAQEVGLGTPEVVAEFMDRGILPLQILSPDGPQIMFCTSPVTSIADMAGKQVRASSPTIARQIEAMGGVPVSMPYPEVYEALQRGILDCLQGSHALGTTTGTLEVAPYITNVSTTNWAPAHTNLYAGSRVLGLPIPAQQLILEAAQWYDAVQFESTLNIMGGDAVEQMEANGGEWLTFDEDLQALLAAENEEILADIAASEYFDGEDLVARAEAASAAWEARVNELGYVDEGPNSTFPEWFTPGGPYDAESWFNAVVTEVLGKHSPV